MKSDKNGFSRVRYTNISLIWIKRFFGILLFLILYFTVLRPFRNWFSSWVVSWVTGNVSADYILTLKVMVEPATFEWTLS